MRDFVRDIRDPIALGEALLSGRENAKRSLSRKYDDNELKYRHNVPPYEGQLIGYYTAAEYRAELEASESRHAKSMLEAMDKGEKFDANYV